MPVQKSRKPSAQHRRTVQKPPQVRSSSQVRPAFFVESPPDTKPPAVTFPSALSVQPPTGSAIIALPIAAVRNPASERLLMRKSEPPPTTPDKAPRVAKTKGTKAKTARAAKPKKKAAKPANKPVAKTVRRKTPTPPKPKVVPATATSAVVPVKDVAPAVPPTMPLPRSAAVTTWRKNGPIDVLAYWIRSSTKSLFAKFKSRKKVSTNAPPPRLHSLPSEVDQLRAENALLRERIEQLLDSRIERMKDA
jgi:hypothetical protein